MPDNPPKPARSMDRRQFLKLAGATAAIGALVLATTSPRKVFQNLTAPPSQGTTMATQGKRIWTPAQQTGTSFLSKLLGRQL